MEKSYIEDFRNILRRVKSESNQERYNNLFTSEITDEERRLLNLFQKFWPDEYLKRTVSIDEYVANSNVDKKLAQKHIQEMHKLLDLLGWE